MTHPDYDQAFWEQLWTRTLRENGEKVARKPPNSHLLQAARDLIPGRALDIGCGHGAETLWLATKGWEVTALDFSGSALAKGAEMAQALGQEVADRVTWIECDIATWPVPSESYDLVLFLYVHVAGEMSEMVRRISNSVARGGTLFMVGHRPIDPATGLATIAAGQHQITVADALAVLNPTSWNMVLAEERPRPIAGAGVDVVIQARRLT